MPADHPSRAIDIDRATTTQVWGAAARRSMSLYDAHRGRTGDDPARPGARPRTQRIARKLRLALGRRLANQDIARTNAADASATLRERRNEHEAVDEYLQAWRLGDVTKDTEQTEETGTRMGNEADGSV